jgi:transcriptional regulator with XRE-family HTH domain
MIRCLRIRADLTQDALARLIGRSKSYFSLIERGHSRASQEILAEVSRALKLSLAEEQQLRALRQQPFQIKQKILNLGVVFTMKDGQDGET